MHQKSNWEIATYTKPKPVHYDGIKCYEVLFKREGDGYMFRIWIWTRQPRKAMAKIISENRSERDLMRLHMKFVDHIL